MANNEQDGSALMQMLRALSERSPQEPSPPAIGPLTPLEGVSDSVRNPVDWFTRFRDRAMANLPPEVQAMTPGMTRAEHADATRTDDRQPSIGPMSRVDSFNYSGRDVWDRIRQHPFIQAAGPLLGLDTETPGGAPPGSDPAMTIGMVTDGPGKGKLAKSIFTHLKQRTDDAARMAKNTVIPQRLVGNRSINLADLEGGTILAIPGDPSIVGRVVNVDGVPYNISHQGGPGYPRMPRSVRSGTGWATDPAAAQSIQSKVDDLARTNLKAKGTGEVFGAVVPMSPEAIDFTQPAMEILWNGLDRRALSSANVAIIDKAARKLYPKWLGLNHPEIYEQLQRVGKARSSFAKALNSAKIQKLEGIPDVAQMRSALMDPNHMKNSPYAVGGNNPIIRMTPGAKVGNNSGHGTYTSTLDGEFVGNLTGNPMSPYDWFENIRKYKNPAHAYYSLRKGSGVKRVTRKWLEKNREMLLRSKQVFTIAPILAAAPGALSTDGES